MTYLAIAIHTDKPCIAPFKLVKPTKLKSVLGFIPMMVDLHPFFSTGLFVHLYKQMGDIVAVTNLQYL